MSWKTNQKPPLRALSRVCTSLVVLLSLSVSDPASAMPRNVRQVPEGYWVGGAPDADDIQQLYDRGVRLLISAYRPELASRQALERLGMRWVDVHFGNHFRERLADRVLAGIAGEAPDTIYIHCNHGGDRAGAVLAFVLVAVHDWSPTQALLAVANPSPGDVGRLVDLLEAAGPSVSDAEREAYAGIYSGASNGGSGGLKIRGPDYRNLVATTLEAMAGTGESPRDDAPESDGDLSVGEEAGASTIDEASERSAPAGQPHRTEPTPVQSE